MEGIETVHNAPQLHCYILVLPPIHVIRVLQQLPRGEGNLDHRKFFKKQDSNRRDTRQHDHNVWLTMEIHVYAGIMELVTRIVWSLRVCLYLLLGQ